jgi:hypothetical protein
VNERPDEVAGCYLYETKNNKNPPKKSLDVFENADKNKNRFLDNDLIDFFSFMRALKTIE